MIDILIPNYHRAKHIPRLIKNLREVTVNPYHITFIIERNDELARIESYSSYNEAQFIVGSFNCYAHSINTGYFLTKGEFVFPGVDDIEFTKGWDEKPIQLLRDNHDKHVISHRTTGKDCPDDGIYSCHFTIRRSYIHENSLVTLMPNLLMYPYYHHEVDRELYWTAKNRDIHISCPESNLIHTQEYDEVQKKTISKDDIDRNTYNERRHYFRGA